jgi:ribonuclease E
MTENSQTTQFTSHTPAPSEPASPLDHDALSDTHAPDGVTGANTNAGAITGPDADADNTAPEPGTPSRAARTPARRSGRSGSLSGGRRSAPVEVPAEAPPQAEEGANTPAPGPSRSTPSGSASDGASDEAGADDARDYAAFRPGGSSDDPESRDFTDLAGSGGGSDADDEERDTPGSSGAGRAAQDDAGQDAGEEDPVEAEGRGARRVGRERGRSRRGVSGERAPRRAARAVGPRQIVINYVPGEECRVAILVNGKLDEFHSERSDQISHVGNIYVGRVTNVEPAIQAAFVDFGLEQNGFLHTSDVHPRYFPGEGHETTERVGKKTPRRERPPIQECLKRGQEVIVQVLKEGVGTKGPTLTSYLSIPGRYLVMMPGMDRVGVSRKVEDEDLRRRMVEILDQLDLPEGFGFILRTAGLEASKTELKRDLAYLNRLQKDMERRRRQGTRPRLLYSESDLLVRCLRDMLTPDTDTVVIDSELGLQRAARFVRLVSPKGAVRMMRYTGDAPIFHALGVEEQLRTMYAREVPLPSGGRLVIDETEALVAIDVNSGKHREVTDSETNAYRTNMEAVEEISRQLRLRDMGGIVINDLIDMRQAKHRREVEERFDELMAADRAKSTLLPISEFGILEMTRQRMRASHESIHFHSCPHCHGRGLIQRPESVAADGLRELASLLAHQRVAKVEMVVHPRVAAELLSGKRRALARVERTFRKTIAVRLSEATHQDRVTFYAYDDRGNDIEIDRLPRHRASVENGLLKMWEDAVHEGDDDVWADPEPEPADEARALESDERLEMERQLMDRPLAPEDLDISGENFTLTTARGGKTRRRGGKDSARAQAAPATPPPQVRGHEAPASPVVQPQRQTDSSAPHSAPMLNGESAPDTAGAGEPGEGGRRRRRRRRRRGRGGSGTGTPAGAGASSGPNSQQADAAGHAESRDRASTSQAGPSDDEADAAPEGDADAKGAGAGDDGSPGEGGERRRRRRRRGRRGRGGGGPGAGSGGEGGPAGGSGGAHAGGSASGTAPGRSSGGGGAESRGSGSGGGPATAQAQPRRLYGAFRRLKPGQRPPAPDRD